MGLVEPAAGNRQGLQCSSRGEEMLGASQFADAADPAARTIGMIFQRTPMTSLKPGEDDWLGSSRKRS